MGEFLEETYMPHERKEQMKSTGILHKSTKSGCKKAGNVVVSLIDLIISKTKCRRAKALRPLRFAENHHWLWQGRARESICAI